MKIVRPSSKQPLPENAKLVFKGIIFDTYQWEVDGYDGSRKIFEKLKRPDTAMIIPITEDGKIILALQEQPHKPPFIGTVGGRVDEGEDVLEAAKRELLEETGYIAKEWLLFDAVQPVSKIEWAVYTFIAKGCKKVAEQNLDGAEKIELKFISFEEFINLAINDDKFGDEFKIKILEAKLNPNKMAEIKKLILG
ncbi:MAG: ADP-ribose pyrophosphatase [Parcubacteria group bacterium Gr01-1014_24]|nr:MAG: ADP-ribose pyrophosphatase [Parcubacteria group bacterium Gr01-1014_24]